MTPAKFNVLMNTTEIDFDYLDKITLEDAIDMVEFQESLNIEDLDEYTEVEVGV